MRRGSCWAEAAGFEVGVDGEAVGSAAQDSEHVVGALDAAVAGPPCSVPVEDLVVPGEDRVDAVAELGYVAGALDIREPVQRLQGAFAVFGEAELVQLAERVPGCPQPRMGPEELVEPLAFGGVELVGATHQQEPRSEHFWVERRGGALGTARDISAHREQHRCEPSDHVEPVQHMAGVAGPSLYRCFVFSRAVGRHDLRSLAPLVSLRCQKAAGSPSVSIGHDGDHLAGVHVHQHRHTAVPLADRGLVHQQHTAAPLPVAFVGAALPEIDETLLADRGMTFFQRCARARLASLLPADTAAALRQPIQQAGGHIDDDALEHLISASGGHPFTIQLLGYHTWEMATPGARINSTHAAAGAMEADHVLLEQIVKPIWSGLSDMDRSFLWAMSLDEADSEMSLIAERIERSSNFAQTYRRRLIDVGAIEPAGRGKVRFAYQQMRSWLRSHR